MRNVITKELSWQSNSNRCNVNVTESFIHKSNTNDVDQTAHLFNRFIVVVCIAVKSISQYHFVFYIISTNT